MRNIAAIFALFVAGNVFSQTLTNGLVGYWPMDNTQSTELTDHTATGNHGSFVQGTPFWTSGKFGNALEVYQTTLDRAEIPHHAAYNANNTCSIAFWYYPIDGYRRYQFSKGESKVLIADSNGASLQLQKFGSPWMAANFGFKHSVGAWHHLVIIYEPSAANANEAKRVYVDGALVGYDLTSGVGTDTALNTDPIVFSSPSDSRKSSGRYDDVAIWDRVLTTTEIAYLYNAGAGNIVADLNMQPNPPTNVTAFASDQLAVLSWAANTVDPDAYAYNVHRGTGSGGPYTWVGTNITDASYVDTGLANGTPYYYVIRSVDVRLAESGNSAEVSVTPVADSTPPAIPSGLTASEGYTRVYLTWDANTEQDFAGYNVYFSTSGGGPFVLTQALVSSTAWTHGSLANGVRYYYRITSEDFAGNESLQTAVVSAAPAAFHDTNRGLVGYWPMDSDSGTALIDASKTGNNGAFVDGTPYWTAGKIGNALALDNGDGTVAELARIPHHAAYIANDTFTVSFWHQPNNCYRKSGLFEKGSLVSGASNWDAAWQSFGSQPWQWNAPLGYELRDGLWHLVTLVYDPSVTYGKLVYVDGALVASNTAAGGSLDAALNTSHIELKVGTGDREMINLIDDVAIWDRPLTLDQIESLWNEGDGRPAYTPPPSGTVVIVR